MDEKEKLIDELDVLLKFNRKKNKEYILELNDLLNKLSDFKLSIKERTLINALKLGVQKIRGLKNW